MPTATRGKVAFQKNHAGTHDGHEDDVEEYFCHPKPRGRRRGANPQLDVPVVYLQDHLQASEAGRLLTAAANQGETLTFDTLWPQIKTLLSLDNLTIDLAGIPADWRRAKDCHDCRISVSVDYDVYTIVASVTEAMTFSGENYPQGDTIAAWRACEPFRYKFIQRCTFNQSCCPGEEDPGGEIVNESGYFNAPSEFGNAFPWNPGWHWKPSENWMIKPQFPYWIPQDD